MYPPPLFFWAFPPWRACEVEVRYPPKRVSQRYWRDSLWKQGKSFEMGAIPPSLTLSRKGIASKRGAVSRTGPLRKNCCKNGPENQENPTDPWPRYFWKVPLLKKEVSPAVLRGREFWNWSQIPWIIGLGGSQPHSQGEFHVSWVFPEFSGIPAGKSQPNWGCGPIGVSGGWV